MIFGEKVKLLSEQIFLQTCNDSDVKFTII